MRGAHREPARVGKQIQQHPHMDRLVDAGDTDGREHRLPRCIVSCAVHQHDGKRRERRAESREQTSISHLGVENHDIRRGHFDFEESLVAARRNRRSQAGAPKNVGQWQQLIDFVVDQKYVETERGSAAGGWWVPHTLRSYFFDGT